MNTNKTLIMHYNVDSQGNPLDVKIDRESNQVSSVHNTVQLEQIPSETHNIVILDDKNKEMYEVDNLEDINESSYYVNYNSGLIHFHPSKAGKTHIFSYYGKGYELIGASRIYDEHSYLGKYIFETLQELIDRGRECIEALNTIGNAVELLRRIENYIIVATELDIKLREDIAIGTPLQLSLHQDIEDANEFRVQFNKDVQEGKILQPILQKTVDDANDINTILNESNENAQTSINLIRSAGNPHYDVLTTDWVANTDIDATAKYMKDIVHNLETTNIQVTIDNKDNGLAMVGDYKKINANTIRVFSNELVNITVILSARYYDGGSDIGDEVKLARKGEVSLKAKIDSIDTNINTLNNEIITARGSNLTLDERLDGIDLYLNNDIEKYPTLEKEIGVVNEKYRYGDIRRYGAIKSDTIDSTTAIQNAINSWGEVIIPIGSFLVKNTIILKPNVKVVGEGINSILYTDVDITMFKNITTDRYDGVQVSDLTIYKHFNNSSVELLNLTNISHSNFYNVYIRKTGTNISGGTGIKIGNNTDNSRTYYNSFDFVKIDGFDLGVDINSGSNANNFISCKIINCKNGMKINKTNSITVLGTGLEMLTEDGITIENSSLYNNIISCRFETCRKSVVIPYSASSPSYYNFIIGGLDYSTSGSDARNSNNIIVDKNSRILSSTEYSSIVTKSFVNAYVGVTKPSMSANVWNIVPYDKTQSNVGDEYNISTYSFTANSDGNYSICATLQLTGSTNTMKNIKLGVFVDDSLTKVIGVSEVTTNADIFVNGSCIERLTKGQTVTIKAYHNFSSGITYNFNLNRLNIAKI